MDSRTLGETLENKYQMNKSERNGFYRYLENDPRYHNARASRFQGNFQELKGEVEKYRTLEIIKVLKGKYKIDDKELIVFLRFLKNTPRYYDENNTKFSLNSEDFATLIEEFRTRKNS